MNIVPTEKAGVWINKDWTPGSPGTFAVIIGVSKYDHLDESQQAHHLGQLFVSATTAFSFFQWLEEGYRRTNCPMAMCWLLLSPTDDEIQFEPRLAANPCAPTFANCKTAIEHWWAEMSGLPQASAQKSRSIFFFSGHGVEVLEDRQVLLPRDYLRPPVSNENEALSTQNLSRGLKALRVPHHFFFLDACRNDYETSIDVLEGSKILNEQKNRYNNPSCFVPLFYATAAGQQAWQPDNPS